ncbi:MULTISPECIES: PQQ-binding-like beta-propeller repeat protein [unclassified Maridesulfovibrio]|uniref:beta-alanine-activating enzyme beta-propeller domain-containing protein n=1 Tax=unclassified Maridesulfovibrio TaxID=2794999 RepID=UPI003B402F2E
MILPSRFYISRINRFSYVLAVILTAILLHSTAFAAPGDKKWEYSTGDEIESTPAIDSAGTLYFGSTDNKLYAINPDGTKKWEFATGDSIRCSPAIADDGTIYIGSSDKKLYALNTDGTKKWEFSTGSYVVSSPAIAADGTIYVGSYDGSMYALNQDGTEKWAFASEGIIRTSPAIAGDGTIYFGSTDKKLYAINPDGTKKWEFTTGGSVYSPPSIASDGTVYFGSHDTNLYALNPDGTKKWEFDTGAGSLGSSPVIMEDGTILIGSADTNLYAINPDGTKKWEFSTTNHVNSSSAIAGDGTIYVGSTDTKLYAVNPDGTKKWEFVTGGGIEGSPTIASDGTVYIGSYDGKLYAIESDSGELASTPWPKFRKDIKNTGRKEPSDVQASQTQADGVVVGIQNSCSKELDATDLDSKYRSGGVIPKTEVISFNATVNSNGAAATFRISSTTIPTGKVSDLTMLKLYDTNGTSRAFNSYALSGPEYNLDGHWWLADSDDNHMALTDDTTLGTQYYVYFVIKDNGDYDEDRDLGEISDPAVVGVNSSSAGTGCTLNPRSGFGFEWFLLGISVFLMFLRGRLTR